MNGPPKPIAIYIYNNVLNNNVYVGQTNDMYRRNWAHLHNAAGTRFELAIQEYGVQHFCFEIIMEVQTEKEADKIERDWIACVRELLGRENVYNDADGGSCGSRGYRHTDEAIAKITLASTGRSHTDETRQKIAAAKKGKSNGLEGKPKSEETKAKIAIAHTGMKHTETTKVKMSESSKGRVATEETKHKMSVAGKAKVITQEHCLNISKGKTGKKRAPFSDATKKAMSEGQKARRTASRDLEFEDKIRRDTRKRGIVMLEYNISERVYYRIKNS